MTNADKCRTIAAMFETGREDEAYSALSFMLATRRILSPSDLEGARMVDMLCDLKNKPIQEPSL